MKRSFPAPVPLDLRRTLGAFGHGRDPSLRVDVREAWRATRTPLGPASIHLLVDGGVVRAEAWGSGAEWALDGLPALLGADDDIAGFAPMSGLVSRLHRRLPGLRFGKSLAVFEALLPVIIGQKVIGKQAGESYRSLVGAHGEPAPGPSKLTVPPAPEVLAGLGYEAYHPHNIEKRRADVIRTAAHRAARLEEIVDMAAPKDRMARLTAFPGIGPWTAALTMQTALGDADAVAVGDYNLPSYISWNLAGEPRGDDARMLELLEPYRGHRARVVRLIKAGGSKPPRYGPRLPLQRIERL